MEGYRNSQGEVVLKPKILEEGMKLNWNFFGGGGAKQNLSMTGNMDIFWNCTIHFHASSSTF